MIEYILVFFGAFALVIVYSMVFLMGYHAASRQVTRTREREDNSDEEFALSSSRLSYNWNLSAEEIEKIEDWEEFEEKAEE